MAFLHLIFVINLAGREESYPVTKLFRGDLRGDQALYTKKRDFKVQFDINEHESH